MRIKGNTNARKIPWVAAAIAAIAPSTERKGERERVREREREGER
jgi:hypothetical protein